MASPAKTALQKMKEIGLRGAQTGVVGAINRRFVRAVTDQLGDACPDILKTAIGQKALEGLLPGLIMFAAQYDTSNRIPYKDQIVKVAEVAFEDWSRDGMSQLTDVVFNLIEPFIEEYRQAAESMQLTEEEVDDFEGVEDFSRSHRRELAHAAAGAERSKTI